MRHAIFGRRLSRDINARKALLANLASDLLEHGEITTTLAKAKFARPYVEKIITTAKQNQLYKSRRLASILSPGAFARLRSEIAAGFGNRPGGYTRIIRLNERRGDNAQMAKIQLVAMEKVEKPKVTRASKDQATAKTTAPAAKETAKKETKAKKPASPKGKKVAKK